MTTKVETNPDAIRKAVEALSDLNVTDLIKVLRNTSEKYEMTSIHLEQMEDSAKSMAFSHAAYYLNVAADDIEHP